MARPMAAHEGTLLALLDTAGRLLARCGGLPASSVPSIEAALLHEKPTARRHAAAAVYTILAGGALGAAGQLVSALGKSLDKALAGLNTGAVVEGDGFAIAAALVRLATQHPPAGACRFAEKRSVRCQHAQGRGLTAPLSPLAWPCVRLQPTRPPST